MSKQNKLTSRRAVAPVIATLLLVAIAVVGGSIVFVFSQGFFSSAQISGAPQIESMQIVGYDARDVAALQLHDGQTSGVVDGVLNDGLVPTERIAIYVQNQGVAKASLTEVRFAGTVYNYAVVGANTALEDYNAVGGFINQDEFVIVSRSNAGAAASISTATNPELQPGQIGTIYLELDETLKEGRDAQIKLTTANGAVFVGTVIAGQQSG
jgi:flagellin-like protein